jgi:hypothetical protein
MTPPTRDAEYRLRFERLWRSAGVIFVVLAVVAAVLPGARPGVRASHEALTAYYVGNESPVLIAATLSGLGILLLMWFAAAIRAVLVEAGQDGWGAAVTTASSATGALLLLQTAVIAALAYSIAGPGNDALTSALNDLAWAIFVLSSWPRAMLVMASSFGFWRAGLISNNLFVAALVVVVLGVLGGTTWEADFGAAWTPDGIYSAVVWPVIGLAWVLVASRTLARTPSTRTGF